MRLPEGRLRRADMAVGSLYFLSGSWGTWASVWRLYVHGARGKAIPPGFLVGWFFLSLLFAVPGIGVAFGKRFWFGLTAALSFLEAFGSVSQALTLRPHWSFASWAYVVFEFAAGVYCVARLVVSRKIESA